MGFFSSKKEEKKSNESVSVTEPKGEDIPKPKVEDSGKLVPPPIPGGSHLDDIKTQVTSSSNEVDNSTNNELIKSEEASGNLDSLNMDSNNVDSLFDLSELDLPETQIDNSLDNSTSNSSSAIDPSSENLANLNFTRSTSHRKEDDNIFVTTSQFKTLLSIIESVKTRVKEANETHLRLMDIKSEEDIEYENLRKTFQFIEDKLYEVDSLIFEK